MKWLRKRFGEKSTYTGTAVIGALLTMIAGPEAAESAALLVGLGASAFQVLASEKTQE